MSVTRDIRLPLRVTDRCAGGAGPLGWDMPAAIGVKVARPDALVVNITGDYGFQRISRKTNDGSGEVSVPIQQSLGRIGIAISF